MRPNEKTSTILKMLNLKVEEGLNEEEVQKNQEKYGKNELHQKKKKSIFILFISQFSDILAIILILAAILSITISPSEWVDAFIIGIVVLMNAIIGTYQEYKAEKSLEALKKLNVLHCKVYRSGSLIEIETKNLVPGDILFCEAGDIVPADARILECSMLRVDESSLTGESVPSSKATEDLTKEFIPLGDRKNTIFSSTIITNGSCKAIVTDIGMNTEIGKIADKLQQVNEEPTPLQKRLTQIGRVIGMICIGICIAVFILEYIQSKDIFSAFENAIALAVAAIPEGLATVVTVVLSIGIDKMAKQNAIIKKLPAVETLGCTSVICSDKTGTLTQNKMTVVKIYRTKLQNIQDPLDIETKQMLSYFACCCNAKIERTMTEENRIGDPTETALLDADFYYGMNKSYEKVAVFPFDSERKMMTVIIRQKNGFLAITKGALDSILSKSKYVSHASRILDINQELASDALRVLGIGIRCFQKLPDLKNVEEIENDLDFLGLIGMIDPEREEVKEFIQVANDAGITTVMITGDHLITANAIAKRLGILSEQDLSITSTELKKISDTELLNSIERYKVYARVDPSDKMRIIQAWQKKGRIVAMTGDGVNDAPALKQANIGCAMGITGTQVAQEASSMTLMDDNFATIIKAVQQGRNTYDNIKKTVHYLLSSNIGEVVTIFLASLISVCSKNINFGIPLLSIHLLWINLLTDSLPALSLGFEKADDNIMKRPPRSPNESFFSKGLGFKILWQGVLTGLLTLIAYILGHSISKDSYLGQTMAFVTLSMLELSQAFNVKSENSLFHKDTWNNKYLNLSLLLGSILLACILNIPFLSEKFKLIPLNFYEFFICFFLTLILIFIVEIEKLISRTSMRKRREK